MSRSRIAAVACAALACLLAVTLLSATPATAAVHDGNWLYTPADQQWWFWDKFCFDNSDAHALFTLVPAPGADPNTQYINFYSDQDWDDAIATDSGLTCQQRVALAKQSYSLTALGNAPKFIPVRGSVPRWWYVAFSSCGSGAAGDNPPATGIALQSYKIELTNQPGTFEKQFSMDEQGILEMSIFFAVLFLVLMVVLGVSVCLAKKRGDSSSVIQLVFVSMLLEFTALLFNIGHYGKYSQDGRGVEALSSLWFFADFLSTLVLVWVITVVSAGWTRVSKAFASVSVFGLLGLYIALYVWIHYIRDPWETTYDYETGLGWTIVAVRGLLTLYVLATSVMSFVRTRAKAYLLWGFFAVCWMLSLCVWVGIAHTFEAWKRRRIVFGLMASAHAAIYLIMTCFFFSGDAIARARTPQEIEAEKERQRIREKEISMERHEKAQIAVPPADVAEKRLDVNDEHEREHSHSGNGEGRALMADGATKAAVVAGPAVVPAAVEPVKLEDVVVSSPLADPNPAVASDYHADDDGHVLGHMDYSSVFALKQNVLDLAHNDDALDDNEVHFVLHQ